VLTLEEAYQIVDSSEGLALGPCTCRAVFHNCDNVIDAEIMVGLGRNAFVSTRPDDYRVITREEAKSVLKRCHEGGLIHTLIKCRQDFYALCNCCPCCCVPLRLKQDYGIGNALTRGSEIVQEFRKRNDSHLNAMGDEL